MPVASRVSCVEILKVKKPSIYRKRQTVVYEKPKHYEDYADHRRKRLASENEYRVGPAPREELDDTKRGERLNARESLDIGSLDSELDVEENKESSYTKLYASIATKKNNKASSKTLLIYFSKMANKSNKDKIDYNFLSSLIQSGACINVCDKHGQTVMHEVARNWNTDVAKFLIVNGVNMNKSDKWGRTPLHLAAAVNHSEMVDFLLRSGANAMPRTLGESQTPIHYAAKYNAVSSLKILIEYRVDYNDRDYKDRTPIFLAAEMAQEDSARYLIDIGVPVGVFDDTGMSAIALMIEKMPHIAEDALNQFQSLDVGYRKESFYLNFLESNPDNFRHDEETNMVTFDSEKESKMALKRTKRLACPSTALELAVKHCEYNVIMHPVMQQLIRTKWNLFGRVGACIEFTIHLIFCIVWSVLGILLPRDGKYYITGITWRIPTEIFGVVLTLFFIIKQILESKLSFNESRKFRLWRIRQIKRDLEFCHPRWIQEKTFLENEMKNIHPPSSGLLRDPWNIMEFFTYLSVLLAIITRVVHIYTNADTEYCIHVRAYAFSLIFLWIHFMKSCRAFTTLGLFITMLGSVVKETLIFAFLCFEFLIPYTVGFWILFGGHHHSKMMEQKVSDKDKGVSVDWDHFHNLIFSVWQLTLVTSFNPKGLFLVDKLMAQIMVGTFFALCSMVCLNLHIALLTETFRQVYRNSKAHASQLQAITVLNIEKVFSKKRMAKFHEHFQTNCAPLVICSDVEPPIKPRKEYWLRTVRLVATRLNEFSDFVNNKILNQRGGTLNVEQALKEKYETDKQRYKLYQGLLARDKELHALQLDIYEMKCALLKTIDKDRPLPRKPKYKPLPELDIPEPSPPLFFGKWHGLFKMLPSRKERKMSPASMERRKTEAALKGVQRFKDLLRKKVASKRASKHVVINEEQRGDEEDGYDSDFETIEMSEVESLI